MSEIEIIREAIREAGSIRAAERLLNISERTIRRRLRKEVQDDLKVVSEVPVISDVDELIQERIRKFRRLQKATEASTIRDVYLKTNKPIGVGFFGDTHMDDDGTNIEKVFRHAELFNGQNAGLYGFFLGDVWNNWVGRLTRLWADQSTNAREAQLLVEKFFNSVYWLAVLLGNHDCLDEQTEVLTKRGWLHHSELTGDDLVLSLNTQTNGAEWHPVIEKITRKNTDRMVNVKAQGMDMMVTPNHRVLHRKRKSDHTFTDMDYTSASTLPHRFRIPVAGHSPVSFCELTDDQIRLVGWVLTDGSIHRPKQGRPQFTIYQSKDTTDIRALLDRLGFEYTESTRHRDITEICGRELVKEALPQTEFRIKAKHSDHISSFLPQKGKLPDWTFDLDDRQFTVLLEALISGDGTWDGTHPEKRNCAVLHGSKEFLDSVQAVAVVHGWRAMLSVAREKDYRLNLVQKDFWEGERAQTVSESDPVDTVWCISTPLTNFMVRRNGKAFFTGNCWNGKTDILEYMLKANTSVVAAHEQRIRLHFPNGRTVLIHARHRFPGHSQWTKQFGQIKAAMLGGNADIYVGGDKHVSGYSNGWHDGVKKMWHAIQVASYKEIDEYPVELGLAPADIYQCPVAIIDPKATGPLNFIRWEFDPEEGAERLAWQRSRA